MSPCRMEEASVAGESPDKSEQQKSSGTARSEHDPRLSVFREPASPAESGGRTDTATAVFGTQRSESAADGEPAAGSAAAAAETPEGPQSPVKAPGTAPDAPEESGEPREPAGPAEGEEPAGAADAAEADAADPAEAPESAAAEADGDAAEPEEGDVRLRAAVAAWVSTDGEAQDGDDGDAGGEKPAAESRKPSDEPAEPSTDEPAGRSDATAESEARVPRTREESDENSSSGADEGSGPDSGAKSEESSEPKPDADSEPKPDANADTDPGTKPDGKSDGAESDAKSGAKSKAVPEPEPEPEPGEDSGSGSEGDSDSGSGAAPDGDVDGDVDGPAAAKTGIDQATAVFKAPKLPRVDQPTTALKITPPSAGKPKPGTGGGTGSEPESAAERTSKFVPLRADDVRQAPAPRAPETPAPASGPGRSESGTGPAWAAQLPPDASLSGAERTRQQPMPPRPPLDLLAELTNTPPPPETPVRTAVRRVKIWTPLVLLLLIAFAIVQMVRPLPDPSLTLSAKPTYTFDGAQPSLPWPDQGQGYMAATGLGKVGSFGKQKPVPIASVAKAMTAYLVLKDHPLKRGEKGPGIPVDAKAESDGKLSSEGESTLDTVKKGDVLSERDALAALMIPSANNIARLLARWDAGSEKAFVEKMNATADELGMTNTTYTDPSGLTASTVSTAEDLVKLGEKLVEFPALMDITKLPEWKDPSGKTWRNYNTLVPYNNALGIKTGSTTKAGGNLLFAAHKMVDGTDQLIVGAVLGQYDSDSIIDAVNAASKKVMLATLDLLEGAKIVKKGDVVGTVDDGMGGTVPVVATKDVKAVGWSGLTIKLEITDDGKTIPHSAAAGTHVGTLTVGEGASQVQVAVALQSDLTEPGAGEKLTRIG